MIERRKTVFLEETPETEEELLEEETKVKYTFKCKPTWNFQSIEFEVTGGVMDAIEMYNVVLAELQEISPEQPVIRSVKKVPSKKLPKNPITDKQKAIMDRYDIEYDEYTSKEAARKLIDKSIKKSK